MEKTLKKIVWAEGILLGQQHFQQWDLYLENQQKWRMNISLPFPWGMQDLIIDEAALLNNKFRIKKLRGILPEGQLISYDHRNDDPLVCEINSQSGETVAIFLCLPINQQVEGITGYQTNSRLSAWQATYQQVTDLYDSNRQREVLFGQECLMLLQNQEALAPYHYLKIAELRRNNSGNYQLVKTFIPPLLDIQCSTHLQELLSRWIELLGSAMRFLKNNRRQISNPTFGQSDLETFLLLQTLSHTFPVLCHWQQTQVHPQQLFLEMQKLITKLGNFSFDFDMEQFPKYQHQNLTETFAVLDKLLSQLLDTIMPTRLTPLKLRRERDSLYVVDNIDSLLFSKSQFFIAAFFQAAETEWITQFARQIKVGSAQTIDSIVTSALPGVKVTHKQRPPNKLSIKTGYEYFYLEPAGHFWEQIIAERNMTIFVPNNFISATIDLITLQE